MKISIISPSSPLTEEQVPQAKEAINYLASLEHEVSYQRSLFDIEIKTPEERAEQFMEEYLSGDNDLLLASRGGSSAIEVLDLLDYEKLYSAKIKPILGYSDLTTISLALNSYAQKNSLEPIPFYHAPMLFEFVNWQKKDDKIPKVDHLITGKAFETNLRVIKEKVFSRNFSLERSDFALELASTLSLNKSCVFEDYNTPILGGNLSIVSSLIGTDYLPSFKDSVLFIEECNEPTYKIERMLWQMHYAGVFKGLKELWVGLASEANMPDALISKFSSMYGFRTISDLPIGHGDLNFVTKLF